MHSPFILNIKNSEEIATLEDAVSFAQVNQTLTDEQQTQLMVFREEMLGDLMYPSGAYLYSQAIPMPKIQNADFLFQ